MTKSEEILSKILNDLLELGAYNEYQREQSLRGVFNRDIVNNNWFKFRNRQINPTTAAGKDPMDIFIYTPYDKNSRKIR